MIPIMNEYEMSVINKKLGHHSFDADTKRFFRSRVNGCSNKYGFFVTSERDVHGNYPRLYTVRHISLNGNVNTIGKFQEYKTKTQAESFIRRLTKAMDDLKNQVVTDTTGLQTTYDDGIYKIYNAKGESLLLNFNNFSELIVDQQKEG